MASALSTAALPATTAAKGLGAHASMRRGKPSVVCIGQLSPFGGLKAQNKIGSLGLPACADQQFARVVSSLKAQGRGGRGGGALSSTCNAAGEIFNIAAIMNGLVLVGVAVGFVLLRVEGWLEESES